MYSSSRKRASPSCRSITLIGTEEITKQTKDYRTAMAFPIVCIHWNKFASICTWMANTWTHWSDQSKQRQHSRRYQYSSPSQSNQRYTLLVREVTRFSAFCALDKEVLVLYDGIGFARWFSGWVSSSLTTGNIYPTDQRNSMKLDSQTDIPDVSGAKIALNARAKNSKTSTWNSMCFGFTRTAQMVRHTRN